MHSGFRHANTDRDQHSDENADADRDTDSHGDPDADADSDLHPEPDGDADSDTHPDSDGDRHVWSETRGTTTSRRPDWTPLIARSRVATARL